MFDHIIGNEHIKTYFSKALKTDTLPTAMIFTGMNGVGKNLFAQTLSSILLKTEKLDSHPDFHILKPESKSGLHTIESLRQMIDEVHSSAYENQGKVFIIQDAERMQTASANAILKTLEEPNPDTTFILISVTPNSILPTIRSRCTLIHLKPIQEDLIASFLNLKNLDPKWAKLSFGSIGKAIELATKPSVEQPIFDLLTERPIYPKLLIELEKIEMMIEDEDPVKKNQKAERMLAAILIWHRDQYAYRIGGSPYFPDIKQITFPLPTMEEVTRLLDLARVNYQRNVKLSTCLENFFLSI